MLVIENKVWACLSEDTDMFVYGCPRVLKYISLLNHTVVLYDMKSILNELEINQNVFREICILSGSDYDLQINKNNLYFDNLLDSLFELYKKFIDSDTRIDIDIDIDIVEMDSKIKYEFFEWLKSYYYNEKCIEYDYTYNNDYELFKNTYSIFDLSKNKAILSDFKNITIVNGIKSNEKIREILKEDGFVFPE